MMNKLEESIIFATIMYQGEVRKLTGAPFIMHPMEVAQILSTMTDDEDILTAGMLHDVVEDTDGTLAEIGRRFGERVAFLVSSETESDKYRDEDPEASWLHRKEEALLTLKNTKDRGVQMLWLADKLANIRALAQVYSERGEALWQDLHQRDPELHRWYYKCVAEYLELSLNRTGAFKELVKHINFIWPGTFDSEKAKYKKYREVSVEGCQRIGHGAKGDVYRYDDELVIKVYNQNNTYHDVEQEIALARKAFILGIPTAISFGIVSVGDRYGAIYELVDSETVSKCIARSPGQVETYANIMADLARTIHSIEVTAEDGFPAAADRYREYVNEGLALEDEALAQRCLALIDTLTPDNTLIHGDFHTNNVFLQKGEPLLIDMDRLSAGNPMLELSDLYNFYVVLGEDDPAVVENFMGFSYETSQKFFDAFLRRYLGDAYGERAGELKEKMYLLCSIRMIRKLFRKGVPAGRDRVLADRYKASVAALADKFDSLAF